MQALNTKPASLTIIGNIPLFQESMKDIHTHTHTHTHTHIHTSLTLLINSVTSWLLSISCCRTSDLLQPFYSGEQAAQTSTYQHSVRATNIPSSFYQPVERGLCVCMFSLVATYSYPKRIFLSVFSISHDKDVVKNEMPFRNWQVYFSLYRLASEKQ